jgi:peptide/nickel transport system permease protein
MMSNAELGIGLGLFGAIALLALAAPLIAPHDPYAQDLTKRIIPPVWDARGTWDHPLGTDALGRDYLSRILYGGRISLLIGTSVTLLSGVIGTMLGLAGGYFGRRADMAVSFLIAVRLSMPVVLVALTVVATVGGSLQVIISVLALLMWDRFAVVVRAATQQVRSLDYVAAAKAAGASAGWIVFREILPNIAPQVIVIATLEAAHAILLESALSFLGLGVQPPLPSWGLMIAEAKAYMFFAFWVIAIPGLALALLVLSINMIGDGLRQALSPEGRV